MLARLTLIALLLWLVIGPAIWWWHREDGLHDTGSEEASAPVGEPGGASLLVPTERPAPPEPGLEPGADAGSAVALMNRLGRVSTPERGAEITAWLRAHPDRVCELMAAFNGSWIDNYAAGEYGALMRAVFGPLDDLKPTVASGLLACLTDRPRREYSSPPALHALRALSPLSGSTRRALEAWARANGESRWLYEVVHLVIDSAQSGEELRPLVRWAMTPRENGTYRIDVHGVLRAVGKLGDRASALIPEVADYVLTINSSRVAVRALIAIGGEDARAQHTLVGVLSQSSPGLDVAWEFLDAREDFEQILMAALRNESPRVRFAAVSRLLQKRWADSTTLLPVVLSVLTADDEVVRVRAVGILSSLATSAEDVVPTLEAMFRSREERQWLTAAKALRRLASDRSGRFDVTSALRDALQHDNVRVRRLIAQGLMHYEPAEAVPMLRDALRDRDRVVRDRACDGLGELAQHDAGALVALRDATHHADPRVVATAEAWIEEVEARTEAAGRVPRGGK